MIAGGVFDRFPSLQVIVGHMGEGLPFFYWRFGDDLARITADTLQKPVQWPFLKRSRRPRRPACPNAL